MLIGGYVDRVLKRAALNGGWLTYFYTPGGFAKSWAKVRGFAEAAGKDPAALLNANQLPIYVGPRDAVEAPMLQWLGEEWDYAAWSDSTKEAAIIGTVDECVESAAGPAGGRRPKADFYSLSLPKHASRNHCPRDHSTA
jgi:alkanesulfonate monooxygenase